MPQQKDLRAIDVQHMFHPNTNLAQHQKDGPLVLVSGDGCWLQDIDGKRYLDGLAGLWNVNIGHGRKRLAQVAERQISRLAYTPTFGGLSSDVTITLSELLASIAPKGTTRFQFVSGGAEANETAFKVARLYQYMKGNKKATTIVSREFGYHGLSLGAMSATGLPHYWEGFGPLAPGFRQIHPPYCYRCSYGATYGQCDLECAKALEEVTRTGEVAALIAEPVLGAGGVIVPPPEYFPAVRKICTESGAFLIADEVICGFGRTGTMFGMDQWNVQPDIISMAKGITSGYVPLGAIGITEEIYSAIAVPGRTFWHGFTYSGHPVCCAVAVENIGIMIEEDLPGKAKVAGQYLAKRLAELLDLPSVGEIRSMGLLAGIELVTDKSTKEFAPGAYGAKVLRFARDAGLIARLVGRTNVIAICPPLTITNAEIDFIIDTLRNAFVKAGRAEP